MTVELDVFDVRVAKVLDQWVWVQHIGGIVFGSID